MKKELILEFVSSYAKKDKKKILSLLAENAVVSDPHFPMKTMIGQQQLSRGLSWSFGAIKSTTLDIIDLRMVDDTAFVELDTVHHLTIGIQYHYVQLLKITVSDDKISALDTYVTYSPGGIRGAFRRIYSVIWKATDAIQDSSLSKNRKRQPQLKSTTS